MLSQGLIEDQYHIPIGCHAQTHVLGPPQPYGSRVPKQDHLSVHAPYDFVKVHLLRSVSCVAQFWKTTYHAWPE